MDCKKDLPDVIAESEDLKTPKKVKKVKREERKGIGRGRNLNEKGEKSPFYAINFFIETFSRIIASNSEIFTRICSIVSISRTVTVSFSNVS